MQHFVSILQFNHHSAKSQSTGTELYDACIPSSGLPESAMQWINRALVQAIRKTAPPNGYRRKEDCLSFLTMLDLWVVSVEKTELFWVFRNDYSQIRANHYNIWRVIVF